MFAATELLAARWQMAPLRGFHIVLTCLGLAFAAMIHVLHQGAFTVGAFH